MRQVERQDYDTSEVLAYFEEIEGLLSGLEPLDLPESILKALDALVDFAFGGTHGLRIRFDRFSALGTGERIASFEVGEPLLDLLATLRAYRMNCIHDASN